MDFSHDYNGNNELLVVGSQERLQACKCVILAFGDLGYTDPELPSLKDALGEYTDTYGISAIKNKIREILAISQVVTDDEILSINVTSPIGADYYTVVIQLTFGTEEFNVPVL